MDKGSFYLYCSLFIGLWIINTTLFAQIDLELYASGFTRPVAISNSGDSRLFVVEQSGKIKIADSTGSVRESPFLDITSIVKSTGNEQGLLGLAFHPDYSNNGYFYVNYTDADGGTSISRFMVSGTNPDIADPESELSILSFSQPKSNHNGGDLKFGPDGYLYIGTGDGGGAGDTDDNAQDLSVILGKMLRIDVDGGSPYTIPETNPFKGVSGALDEIWSFGLRNPWRYSFDLQTGDLWIADVGQKEKEEINFQSSKSTGGENYGWRCYEGNDVYNSLNCQPIGNYNFPVHEYSHDGSGGCSVTGGFVYRGNEYPSLNGYYFFADYCTDRIWTLHDKEGTMTLSYHGQFPNNSFSTFGEDSEGELFIAGLSSGKVYRITGTEPTSNNNIPSRSRFRVYPNPVKDHMQIETIASGISTVEFKLYSLIGSLCLSGEYSEPSIQLNLNSLDNGVYYLVVSSGEHKEFHKILKPE